MKREAVLLPGTYAAIPKALLEVPSAKLSPAAKLVWMIIVDHFGPTNDHSWPGAGTIAKMTGLTRRGAQKAIDQLVELTLLTMSPPEPGRASNTYRLTEFASALSSLANGVRTASAQSSLPRRTECAGGSEQSAPELPKRTTEPTTEGTTEELAAPPPAALSGGSLSEAGGVDGQYKPASEASEAPPKQKLTDDVLRLIQSDPTGERMVAYWCYGPGAVGKPMAEWSAFAPQTTHWSPAARDHGTPESDTSPPALAAYCWCRFTQARGRAGEQIVMPAFGKLVGTIKTLRSRPMTQEELVGHIDRIAANWTAIRAALSWMSSPPALDEVVLHNGQIIELSNRIARGENVAAPRPSTPSSGLSPAWQIPTGPVSEDKYAHMYS